MSDHDVSASDAVPLTSDTLYIDGSTGPQRQDIRTSGSEIIAYSCRAPDKDTLNEDTTAVIALEDGPVVLVVADGAGGMPAGRRASQTAVAALDKTLHLKTAAEVPTRTRILDGIEAANEAVLGLSNGSATTMTVVAIENESARTYQVGDSEAYICGQRGVVRAQTLPHSPTGFAVEAGFLDQKQALHHEERHLVSNLIGTVDMRIEVGPAVLLRQLDTILVASDGLTDNIHAKEITEIMRSGPLDSVLDKLVSLASHRMNADSNSMPSKPDDLSIILYRKSRG